MARGMPPARHQVYHKDRTHRRLETERLIGEHAPSLVSIAPAAMLSAILMTSGFRGAFETGQTTGAVADARGLTRPSRGGCGPLQGSQGGVKELALWRHEALTYARTREERADCQRLLSVRYARAFTWRARAADASPPVRGKPSPAARTRKNLGPLSETAAGFGKGRRSAAAGVSVVSREGNVARAAPRGCAGKLAVTRGWGEKNFARGQSGSQAAMSSQRPQAHRVALSLL